jgi:general secretion pathway protein G
MISTRAKCAVAFLLAPTLAFSFARAVAAYHGEAASDTRRIVTQETARRLILVLDAFRAAHHRLPSANEGLELLSPGYLETIPADGWGRPFAYTPSVDNMWADVVSYGADGKPGGTGDAADVSGRVGSLALRPPAFVDFLAEMVFFAILLIGLLGSGRSPWAAGMLSGTSAFCALLLFSVITAAFELSLMAVLAPLAALLCLTGSLAVLRRTPGAPVLASGSALCAYALLGKLFAV